MLCFEKRELIYWYKNRYNDSCLLIVDGRFEKEISFYELVCVWSRVVKRNKNWIEKINIDGFMLELVRILND